MQRRDPKFVAARDGILYPRAGTLGGCTAHNAMIFVYPQDSDWDYIAESTGDASWRPQAMRRLFERLENCHHRPFFRLLGQTRDQSDTSWLERLARYGEGAADGRAA